MDHRVQRGDGGARERDLGRGDVPRRQRQTKNGDAARHRGDVGSERQHPRPLLHREQLLRIHSAEADDAAARTTATRTAAASDHAKRRIKRHRGTRRLAALVCGNEGADSRETISDAGITAASPATTVSTMSIAESEVISAYNPGPPASVATAT